MILIAELTL